MKIKTFIKFGNVIFLIFVIQNFTRTSFNNSKKIKKSLKKYTFQLKKNTINNNNTDIERLRYLLLLHVYDNDFKTNRSEVPNLYKFKKFFRSFTFTLLLFKKILIL